MIPRGRRHYRPILQMLKFSVRGPVQRAELASAREGVGRQPPCSASLTLTPTHPPARAHGLGCFKDDSKVDETKSVSPHNSFRNLSWAPVPTSGSVYWCLHVHKLYHILCTHTMCVTPVGIRHSPRSTVVFWTPDVCYIFVWENVLTGG